MTFLDAVKLGKFVRRHGCSRVYCISETPTNIFNVLRSDILADDWETIDGSSADKLDDAEKRFSMIELE